MALAQLDPSTYQQLLGVTGSSSSSNSNSSSATNPGILSQLSSDIANNDFSQAWTLAGDQSGVGGYPNATTNPYLLDLETQSGLASLDPSKQWTPADVTAFYQAAGQGSQWNANTFLGADPEGGGKWEWNGVGSLPGDAAANIAQAPGTAPDLGRFAGRRPPESFFDKWGLPILGAVGLAAGGLGLAGDLGGLGGLGGAAEGAGAVGSDATLGADVLASTAAADVPLDAGVSGLLGATPALDGGALAADAAGAAGAAGAADVLPGLTVTAPATQGAVSAGELAAPAAFGTGALIGAGGTDAATGAPLLASTGGVPGSITDTGASLSPSFLSATGPADITSVGGDVGQMFGVAPGSDFIGTDYALDAPIDTSVGDPLAFDQSNSVDAFSTGSGTASGSSGGFLNSAENFLSKPRNLLGLGTLGMSLASALSKPKLPSYSQAAAGNASANLAGAEATVNSGGVGSSAWAAQKSAIDAQINQQIQYQTQAAMQAAASSGMGNGNSEVVQQQVNAITNNLNLQRQQLYLQAQQQNVTNALQQLTADNSVLTGVGQLQFQQSNQAQQLALRSAQIAAQLMALTSSNSSTTNA